MTPISRVLLLALPAFLSLANASAQPLLHAGSPVAISEPNSGPVAAEVRDVRGATNGTTTLLVTNYNEWRLVAATLLVGGTVRVSQEICRECEALAAFWDGVQFVAFATRRVGPERSELLGTPISADGVVGETRTLHREIVLTPRVAFDGTNYAVAHGAVNVALYNRNLEWRGIDMQLVLALGHLPTPAIASNGNGFVVLYVVTEENGETELRTSRLDDEGRVVATSILDGASHPRFGDVSLASNGVTYLATWQTNQQLHGILLDDRGAPDGTSFDVGPESFAHVTASSGSGYLIAALTDTLHLYRVPMTPPTQVSEIEMAEPVGATLPLSIMSDGSRATLLWVQPRGSVEGLIVAPVVGIIGRIRVDLHPITSYGAANPVLAAGDQSYLVAWQESRWVDGNRVIVVAARLVASDGHPMSPTVWYPADYPIAAAYGGGVFLLLAKAGNQILAARISRSGELLDAQPRVVVASVFSNMCGPSRLGWDGTTFWFIFTDCRLCFTNEYPGEIHAFRIAASGEIAAPQVLRPFSMGAEISDLACSGDQCLLAWEQRANVCSVYERGAGEAMRLEHGAVVDASPIRLSESSGGPQLGASPRRYLAVSNLLTNLGGYPEKTLDVAAVDRAGIVIARNSIAVAWPQFAYGGVVVWDGVSFLVYWQEGAVTNLLRLKEDARRVDDSPFKTPWFRLLASLRDGRSLAVKVEGSADRPWVIVVIPLVETQRRQAIRRESP